MKVDLSDLTQPALIIPFRTSIVYTNQAGGTACLQPEMEGYLIPVEYDCPVEQPKQSLCCALCSLFPESSPGHIDHELANKIQMLLLASPITSGIKIQWQKLEGSFESWLHVIIENSQYNISASGDPIEAIMTWPNSD